MPKGESAALVLAASFLCSVASCTKPEPHFDIPAPVLITQWAERIDTLAGTYTFASPPVQFGDTVIVVADGQDRTVWKIDMRAGTRVQLGTSGDGPGEFRRPGFPVKLPGDSVALLFGTASDPIPVISVVNGRGRTHSIPLQPHANGAAQVYARIGVPLIMWADTVGNVYGQAYEKPMQLDTVAGRRTSFHIEPLDSFPVVRYGFFTGRVDTVLRMSRGVPQVPIIRNANGTTVPPMHLGPYGAFNGWSVLPDGRVLFAEAARFAVTVLSDSGSVLFNRTIASNAISVSRFGWNAYVKKTTNGSSIELKNLQAKTFAKIGVAAPKMPDNQYTVPPMPSTLPRLYFEEGKRHMSVHENTVWFPVHLADPPGDAGWDVIDISMGTRVLTVALPPKQFLVTVTDLGAYVIAIDEDNLQRILLYRRKAQ